jgi:GH18 family chitinase
MRAHRSLDYFVMLGYDYDGPWNAKTGLSTPLYLPEDNPLCVVSFLFDLALIFERLCAPPTFL